MVKQIAPRIVVLLVNLSILESLTKIAHSFLVFTLMDQRFFMIIQIV